MGSHLNRPIYPPEEKFVRFQTPIQTGGVRHANVPWMIHIFGSGADEHIELSMWLRALPGDRSGEGRAWNAIKIHVLESGYSGRTGCSS
jgi:hypothetical protein